MREHLGSFKLALFFYDWIINLPFTCNAYIPDYFIFTWLLSFVFFPDFLVFVLCFHLFKQKLNPDLYTHSYILKNHCLCIFFDFWFANITSYCLGVFMPKVYIIFLQNLSNFFKLMSGSVFPPYKWSPNYE